MAKYRVGWTYTVWVEVEAESKEKAFDNALACEYNFEDVNKSGAVLELNEYEDVNIEEVHEPIEVEATWVEEQQ